MQDFIFHGSGKSLCCQQLRSCLKLTEWIFHEAGLKNLNDRTERGQELFQQHLWFGHCSISASPKGLLKLMLQSAQTQSMRHTAHTVLQAWKENILEGKKSSPRYREGLYLGCPTFQLLIALNILITHGTSPWLSPGPAVNFHLQWTFYEPISQTEFLPAIMRSIGQQFSWKITWPERSNLKRSVHVSACVIHGTAAPTSVLGQTLSCQLALILPRLSGFPQIIKES